MKNKHIIIYAEGSFQLGLGNIFRSMSLADAIVKKYADTHISFTTSSEIYIKDIISEKYPVYVSESQEDIFQYIEEIAPDLAIIDYLDINFDLVLKLRKSNIKIALIGNNSLANQNANLVVNAIIGTNFQNSDTVDSYGTRYLKGPKYLVLRDEFENERGRYLFKGKLETLVLLFGGTDQADFSFHILKKLIDEQTSFNIKLILGVGYRNTEMIRTYVKENGLEQQVQILQNINNVSEELLSSDFLLTSPGTSLFEAFCLGVPALAFFQNKNQEDIFKAFFRTQKFNPKVNLVDHIQFLYKDIETFRQQIDILGIGTGKNEIVNNLINL